jgi:hypothetical protein
LFGANEDRAMTVYIELVCDQKETTRTKRGTKSFVDARRNCKLEQTHQVVSTSSARNCKQQTNLSGRKLLCLLHFVPSRET